MLEKSQKNPLLGIQWDHNWNCQEIWSSYLHFSKHSRWSIPEGADSAPPVLIGLTHTVTHFTWHSFRLKTNNHPTKNSISLEFTWAKILKLSTTSSPSFTVFPFCFEFDSPFPSTLLSSDLRNAAHHYNAL